MPTRSHEHNKPLTKRVTLKTVYQKPQEHKVRPLTAASTMTQRKDVRLCQAGRERNADNRWPGNIGSPAASRKLNGWNWGCGYGRVP